MPGVTVVTATRSGPQPIVLSPSGQYFDIGLTERGPTTVPAVINSMADYGRIFGQRVTYGALYDDLQMFFEEGGTQAVVGRVVGPAATVGSVTVNDSAVTPLPTMTIAAANPGAWSSQLSYQIVAGTTPNTFRLQILLNGVIVEDWNNLANPAAAASAASISNFVKVTDLGSATAAPNNNPAVMGAAIALPVGTDDRASITDTQIVTQMNALFAKGLGDGSVACPGHGSGIIQGGLITHAQNNNRIAILANGRGTAVATMLTTAASFSSEFAGMFAPWVLIPDGIGGTRAVSPEGYIAAVRNRAHDQVGPWRAPGGAISASNFVLGVDQSFDRATGDQLDAGRVNAIRIIANTVRLYGWRSLSINENDYALLTGRDLLNRMVTDGSARLEQYVFQTIDGRGQLLSAIRGELMGMAEAIRQRGGLFDRYDPNGGALLDPGYSVNLGPDINPITALAQNKIAAVLAVRISPTGALINLTIIKVGVAAAV